jgi:hypothetical protein
MLLVAFFLVFQLLFLKRPAKQVFILLRGVAIAFAGLVLLLQGINIAFLPMGNEIGEILGALNRNGY